MTAAKNQIFDVFLAPLIRLFIDEEGLQRLYESIDWQLESDRFRNPSVSIPAYYSSQNFHGIEGGYLNPSAAVSYDPITQYVLPPNETWIRQGVINSIGGEPRRILDLGCGTGSTTILLKQAFPQAEVIGLDLSPYMLVIADYKAQAEELEIHWQHGNAENTGFAEASFDLVTASLLLHETPPAISQSILRECFRLLVPGGQVVILDGNQKTLRHTEWLSEIFEEPYIKSYADCSVDAWMGAAGFESVQTEDLWWVQQITRGLKPLNNADLILSNSILNNDDIDQFPALAFGT